MFALVVYVVFDDIVGDFAYGCYEVSGGPEDWFPVVGLEVCFEFLADDVGGSAFEFLDYVGDGLGDGDGGVEVDVVVFHAEGDGVDVEFFGDALDDGFEALVNLWGEDFSSVFGDPDDVISAVVGDVGCFSVLWHGVLVCHNRAKAAGFRTQGVEIKQTGM